MKKNWKEHFMKTWVLMTSAVIALGLLIWVAVHRNSQQSSLATDSATLSESPRSESAKVHPAVKTSIATAKPVRQPISGRNEEPQTPEGSPVAATAATPPGGTMAVGGQALLRQAVDCLVSSSSGFDARQTALEQLRQAGKLDQAIVDLEQRITDDPRSAETAAALGRVYLHKCGTIQDMREQGILAMKADQVFDAALQIDSSNWDARYTKALAMSYWPTQMNRGTEVMQHLVTLIEQQESQAPQPQFAMPYALLGDEYKKYGHTDKAREIWQRGAVMFPNNKDLAGKLTQQ